jgi:ubiquinone/menaquinone biosynthesis C-methylase UbiE
VTRRKKPSTAAWYREYFSEPYGEVYAEYLLPPDVDREEARFARKVLGLRAGERVLDCPCGYGRHLEQLRREFPNIVGLDLSRDCLLRAAEWIPNARLLRGDVRMLPFRDGAFDAVLNIFNSFGYFGEDENQNVLAEFARVLRSGGRVLIDVANPEPLVDLITEHPRTQQQVHDLLLTEDWSYDADTQVLHNQTRIELGGEVTERFYDLRLYSLSEMQDLLAGAGMQYEAVYGDFDGENYEPTESVRLIVVGKK